MNSQTVRQSLTQLLKYSKGNKGSVLPKPIINQMEKILVSKKTKIYPYQILEIYQHFCVNNDQIAFQRIDSIIFPVRGKEIILQPSLGLAYKRLYCLMKYQIPYSSWLKKIRQLIHQQQINVTDFRHIFTLATFSDLRHNQIFQSIYSEILSIFSQKCPQIDIPALIALRRYIIKGNVNDLILQKSLQTLDKQIEKSINFLTSKQFKFLYQAKINNERWAFQLFFNSQRSIFRKFGFYMMLLFRDTQIKRWTLQKFTINQVFQKYPDAHYKPIQKILTIIDRVYSNSIFYKQFIDEFFQFIKVPDPNTGQLKTKLKNPTSSLPSYLLNLYYYLDGKSPKFSNQTFKRINDILEQKIYVKRQFIQVFMYLHVKLSLAYYKNQSITQKAEKQIAIFNEIQSMIYQKYTNLQKYSHTNYKLLPTHTLKNLGSLQFEVYKSESFIKFFEKFTDITNYIQKSIITSRYPKDFVEIEKIIKVYINETPTKDNIMFFGDMKKIRVDNLPAYIQIQVAKQVQINRKITVDFLIKIKNTQTGKQVKYIMDFVGKSQKPQGTQMKPQLYWKYNYLVNWCKLDYQIEEWTELQDYFSKQKLKKRIQKTKI